MRTRVESHSTHCCASIITFVADERTLAGVKTLVNIEMAAVCTSIIAFVAGEWTFAGVRHLVSDETIVSSTLVITFVAGEQLITRSENRTRRSLRGCIVAMDRLIRCTMRSG